MDVFDSNFTLTNPAGLFTNPNLPAGLAPHGIRFIGNQVYVAYAMQDAGKHDSRPGAGLGQVDIFDANGRLVKTLVPAGGKLNAPWGIAQAPNSFGAFGNAILVGNFGDGTINAFDANGTFLGQLTDSANTAILNPGLWDIAFGAGGNSGDPGTLYLTAGGSNQPNFPAGGSTTSVFASVIPAAAAPGPNFSLNLAAQSTTVSPGGSTNVMIGASAVGGFNGQIVLTCSAPSGLTCALNPSTISPGSNTPSSTLTITAAATPPGGGYGMFLISGLGLFGTVLTASGRKQLTRKSVLTMAVMGLLLLTLLFAVGCGGNYNKPAATQVNVMVTGTSGAISHSGAVAVTIN